MIPAPAIPAFIGRDHELALLRAQLAAALAGHGGLVLIGGEAGVGKTALAEVLAQEAADVGARIFVGHCYDRTETPRTARGANASRSSRWKTTRTHHR